MVTICVTAVLGNPFDLTKVQKDLTIYAGKVKERKG